MKNIYHTIRGRTKLPKTLELNSKDPLSAAYMIYIYIENIFNILSMYPTQKKIIWTTIEWWSFVLTGASTNRRVNGWKQ